MLALQTPSFTVAEKTFKDSHLLLVHEQSLSNAGLIDIPNLAFVGTLRR